MRPLVAFLFTAVIPSAGMGAAFCIFHGPRKLPPGLCGAECICIIVREMSNNKAQSDAANDARTEAAGEVLNGGLLSVVMPCFNLADEIFGNIRIVAELLSGAVNFEILPVDDGSTDQTAAELRRAEQSMPGVVRPVFVKNNSGKGNAFAKGFYRSKGSHILLLDGDLDLNPAFIWKFFEIMRGTGADIVIGSKLHAESRVDYPLKRRLASFMYYSLVKILFGLPVHDTQTGMKLFRREALEYSLERILAKRFAFDLEILAVAHGRGFRVAEAPVELDFGAKTGCLTYDNVRNVLIDTLGIFYRENILGYYGRLESHKLPDILPRVSVVVACPGRTACLDECIAGISRQGWSDLEVIVLPDDAFEMPEWYPEYVRIIPSGRVRPAEKRNLGASKATGGIIAFIDDDATPESGWLYYSVAYFDTPNVCGVGGPAVTPEGDGFMAWAGGRTYSSVFVSGAARRRYKPMRVCDEDDLPSCNLILRKDAFEKAGGFDVRYWPGEDTILCMRLTKELGMRLVYDPRVCVRHHRRPLFGPHLRQVARYAKHRGFFAAAGQSTSRKAVYFVPSVFAACVVIGLPLCFVSSVFRYFYAVCACAYLLVMFAAAFFSGGTFLMRLAVWAGIVATHFVYGINFAVGFFSEKMENRVRDFDHVGGGGRASGEKEREPGE